MQTHKLRIGYGTLDLLRHLAGTMTKPVSTPCALAAVELKPANQACTLSQMCHALYDTRYQGMMKTAYVTGHCHNMTAHIILCAIVTTCAIHIMTAYIPQSSRC